MSSRLDRYRAMRDFTVTKEPSGRIARATGARRAKGAAFVVQKHDARRLHYDFRLEHDGVLLSWAVPKGPSLAPGDKRLAVQTEDHPLDYLEFEGTIPEGQYGGGPVIVWDRGTWKPIGDAGEGLKEGRLDFELDGEKLHGRFLLVRTRVDHQKPSWLLMKRSDEWAITGPHANIVEEKPESILTGRTIEDVVAGVPAAPPKHARRGTKKKTTAKPRSAPFPPFGSISPELATLVKDVPKAGPWLYEIKYDGYRAMAWLEDGTVRIASRRGNDWTKVFAPVADALSRVRAKTAIFDGEIAYVDERGRTDFQKLQNTLGSQSPREQSRLVYFVFDLLHYDGVDLRDEPLVFRKEKLRTILAGEEPPLKLSDHVEDGQAFFDEVCKIDLEGIIGKRADRPYVSKRTLDWIKLKCQKRQELVVVGFTPPKGSRSGIGALLLGLREGKSLRYAGKVGTGFSHATLKDLAERLEKVVIAAPPVSEPPRMRDARWVKPELVAEVRFSEWTSDGRLRQPTFEGLRVDKDAREVHRETERPTPRVRAKSMPAVAGSTSSSLSPEVQGLTVTHADRVIDAATGLTKLDLVRYVGEVAETMLPFAAKRPLMLVRCPEGTQAAVFRQSDRRAGKKTRCFVQKHSGRGLNGVGLGSATVGDEEALFVTNARQLVLLTQNNTLEVHGWGSTLPRWDRPDWIVFDLDPDESLPFARVIDGALEVREALRSVRLESWVKTTGGKGLHVVVPLARRYDWPTVRLVSEEIATLIAQAAPAQYVATMSKKARTGKIFIDYLRNAEGATAVLPYSARARPGLTVAMPVAWKDLRAVDPQELTITTVPKLLARRRTDPWADLLRTKQTLLRELLDAVAR